jgi:putative FmdB family regulatory protein
MPIYEFKCLECDHDFEELVALHAADATLCPKCGSHRVERKMSAFAGRVSGGGGSCGTSGFS